MNILHLEASSGWGGQEIRIFKEAEGMRARGHVVIFGAAKGSVLAEKARFAGFQVYQIRFHKAFWLFSLPILLWMIVFHRITLVNTHSSLDSWLGGIAARILRTPIVRTRHLSTKIKAGINSRIVYQKLADFVVTTCKSIIPMIESQSGMPSQKIRSIATGVEPFSLQKEEAMQFRKSLGVQETDILVGMVCVMRSWKGVNEFLEAAHLLREQKQIRWVVIGGGHAEIHHKKAKELGLDNLVFTGHLDSPFAAIGALDIFALLSTANEGVSQAILQAAYLQKPLIATPVGGLPEVCIDGKTGILVPPFDANAVAGAVQTLQKDPVLRKNFGENGRRLVMNQFTFQQTLDQMEEVYAMVRKI